MIIAGTGNKDNKYKLIDASLLDAVSNNIAASYSEMLDLL